MDVWSSGTFTLGLGQDGRGGNDDGLLLVVSGAGISSSEAYQVSINILLSSERSKMSTGGDW